MLTTALLLVNDAAQVRPGERVLVHSASGGVGLAVAQLLADLGSGARIGTVGRRDKIDSARQSGYDLAISRTDDVVHAVREATGGGVDVVLDPLGTESLETDLAVAAPGARIVLFGNAGGQQSAALRDLDPASRQHRHPRLQRQRHVGDGP
jgi:NADPH2:quinone reductase